MWDAVNWRAIPAEADHVALYDDGALFPSPPEAFAFFEARGVPIDHITVTGQTLTSKWGDIENGDMDERGAAIWRNQQLAAGLPQGGVYTSISRVTSVVAVCGYVDLWTAHYTGVPHLCDHACMDANGSPYLPTNFPFSTIKATQYANPPTSGGDYDISLLRSNP